MTKIAIVDSRADSKTIYSLEDLGIKVIPTMKIEKLYDAVATHADIQIHYLGNNKFVCANEVYQHYKSYLPYDIELIRGSLEIGAKYPYNIGYNATSLKNFVICKADYTTKEILEDCSLHKKIIINVKQGYTKCNCCVIDDNSIITSDKGIAKIAAINCIDVLEISHGNIELRGMDYGFIGGATGLINRNVLAVNGDLCTHSDYNQIKNFCKIHYIDILSLKSGNLVDIGSIITNY